MIFKTRYALFFIGVLLITTSCKAQTDSINYGCSGGFTGGGDGIKVLSDGSIIKWTLTAGQLKETVVKIDLTLSKAVFTRLKDIQFTKIDYQKFGNMTCSLTLKEDGISHVVSWVDNKDNTIKKLIEYSNWLQNI